MSNREKLIQLCKELEQIRTMYINAINQFQQSLKPGNEEYRLVARYSNDFSRCSNELNALWACL